MIAIGSAARRWLVLLAAVVAAVSTLRLGFWQLDRAAQKTALQQSIESRSALPELAQADLADSAEAASLLYQRRIRLSGHWLPEATVFLDNRQMDGRPGFFVMTPLRLDTDVGNGKLVWVQRGWVPRDNDVRTRLPAVPTPRHLVEVAGRIAPPPARLFEFDGDETGPIRQNLDLDASARRLGQTVLPLTVLQTESPTDGDDGLIRHWPSPTLDVDKHHGYAFQWFALSALITGLFVWFQIFRRWRPAQREEV